MNSMSKYTIASQEEIDTFATEHSEWSVEEGKLVAHYTLSSFDHAIEVINAVAAKATEMDHHPKMTNVYNILNFSLCTHHADDQITDFDLELAGFISELCTESSQH